jgi:hypothetical protein
MLNLQSTGNVRVLIGRDVYYIFYKIRGMRTVRQTVKLYG